MNRCRAMDAARASVPAVPRPAVPDVMNSTSVWAPIDPRQDRHALVPARHSVALAQAGGQQERRR